MFAQGLDIGSGLIKIWANPMRLFAYFRPFLNTLTNVVQNVTIKA